MYFLGDNDKLLFNLRADGTKTHNITQTELNSIKKLKFFIAGSPNMAIKPGIIRPILYQE